MIDYEEFKRKSLENPEIREAYEMFHRATDLMFMDGTKLRVKFQSGEIIQYDISQLFSKYPQLEALRDRELFTSGKLQGAYGIVWNEDLDLEIETVYDNGTIVAGW